MPVLRVLMFFINPIGQGYVGGAERRLLEVSKALTKLNVEVHVVELRSSLSSYFKAYYTSHPLAHEIPRGHRGRIHLIGDLIRVAFKLFRQDRFGLIQASRHDLLENVFPAWVLSRIFRVPFVVTFHHLNPDDWVPIWALRRRRARTYGSRMRAASMMLDDVVNRQLYLRADGCLTVSNATKSDMVKALRIPGDKIFVSGDGVDFERLSSHPHLGTKIYDAIFVGRVAGAKGVDVLLEAWRQVVKSRSDVRLLIVGGGELEEVRRCQGRIEELGLRGTVVMTGFVPDDRLVELLKSSKIFILPSFREGFGLGVAEAMACGLPVVISDIPSLRESFSSMASFFPPGDAKRLSEEILALLEDSGLREEMGRRNEVFVRKYDWESVAERELDFMMSLVTER